MVVNVWAFVVLFFFTLAGWSAGACVRVLHLPQEISVGPYHSNHWLPYIRSNRCTLLLWSTIFLYFSAQIKMASVYDIRRVSYRSMLLKSTAAGFSLQCRCADREGDEDDTCRGSEFDGQILNVVTRNYYLSTPL